QTVTFVVSDDARDAPPALLAPVLFRGLVHKSGRALYFQEVFENTLQDRVLLEELRDDPEALRDTSELSRDARWAALGQLNTRSGTNMTGFRSDDEVPPSSNRDHYHSAVELKHATPDAATDATMVGAPPGSPTLLSVLQAVADDGSMPSTAD